jgi:hypothetical protein
MSNILLLACELGPKAKDPYKFTFCKSSDILNNKNNADVSCHTPFSFINPLIW